MASFLIPNSPTLTLPIPSTPKIASFRPMHFPTSPAIRLVGDRRTRRVSTLVPRAGPSMTSYVFAFVFPLSLLIGTIFTSIRIADKLDRDYMEEIPARCLTQVLTGFAAALSLMSGKSVPPSIFPLAINEAIREADEVDGGDDDAVDIPLEDEAQQPALQGTRTRNRPKREA